MYHLKERTLRIKEKPSHSFIQITGVFHSFIHRNIFNVCTCTYLAGLGVTPSGVVWVGPGLVEVFPVGLSPGSVTRSGAVEPIVGLEDAVLSSSLMGMPLEGMPLGEVTLGGVSLEGTPTVGVSLVGVPTVGVSLVGVPTVGVTCCTSKMGLEYVCVWQSRLT